MHWYNSLQYLLDLCASISTDGNNEYNPAYVTINTSTRVRENLGKFLHYLKTYHESRKWSETQISTVRYYAGEQTFSYTYNSTCIIMWQKAEK